MSCVPGSPKTGGRKKGTPNKCRKSIDYFAEQVFKKTDMVAKGIELLSHKDPRVQAMVWCRLMDYKFGRPREQLVISGSVDMRSIVAQARERVLNMRRNSPSTSTDDANTLVTMQLPEASQSTQIMDSGRSENETDVVYLQQAVENLPQRTDGEGDVLSGISDAS